MSPIRIFGGIIAIGAIAMVLTHHPLVGLVGIVVAAVAAAAAQLRRDR